MLKPSSICFVLIIASIWLTSGVYGAPAGSVSLSVTEAAGIRRNAYPVSGRVPFAKGELKDASAVRLLLNDSEIATQVSVESRWPDSSIKSLDVDFNASIGPLERQIYRVEFGNDVKSAATARGLSVTQTGEAIQVGAVRFGKTASPLVLSVAYRQEDIGKGLNGFTVTDEKGTAHELNSEAVTAEVIKSGPIDVLIRYAGKAAIEADYSVPFVLTIEMPNSKSWVKYSAIVDDPAKRIRGIAFNSPVAFGAFPWLWDFGTGSWSYGSFRNASDRVTLTQVVRPGAEGWKIENGPKGQEQLYETAGGGRPKIAEGWGHFQDGKEVIAFAFDKFGQQPGTYTVTFDALGQETFQLIPAQPGTRHQLAVYQHYVGSPTPIGAVTSPASMLNSLVVR
jgi:hypothetical protein